MKQKRNHRKNRFVVTGRRHLLLLFAALGVALVTVPPRALGTTFTYTGGSANPGSWFNITNWSPHGVPNGSDTVIVPVGTVFTPNLTFDDLRITGGTIQGTFTIGGALLWTAGGLSGTVTVPSNAVVNLAFTSAGVLTGVMTNHGRITWPAGSWAAWVFANARLENAADGLLDVQVDGQFHNDAGTVQINNAGVIRKSAGSGTGEFRPGVVLQNTGLLDVQSGGLAFQDGFISSGTFNVTNGSTIDLLGGTFRFQPGHQFTGGGNYGVFGGTVTIDGPITEPNFQFLNGTMTISNQLTGTMHWRNGTLVGALTIATNGLLDLALQSAGNVIGVLTNHGRIVWPVGSYPAWGFNNGRLENAADGLLDAQVDAQFHNFGGTAQINNAGIIRKSAGNGTGEFRNDVALQNTGVLDIRSGGVAFTDGFTSSGTFNVTNGSTIDLNGGTFHFQPGHQFTGGGNYGVFGGTVTIDGPITEPNFQFLNGTMTISNQLTGTMHWRNGTLVGALMIATNGLLDLALQSAGTVTGVLTNHGRIVWPVGSYPAWGFNNGRLENAADGLLDAQLDCQFHNFGGSAQINNAGIIRKSAGVGTGFFNGVVGLQNTGMLDVQSGGLQLPAGYTQSGGQLNCGLQSASQYGRFIFTSAASLTGTLSANLIGGYQPSIGDSFNVLSYPSQTGLFTSYNLPAVLQGGWDFVYGTTTGTLRVTDGRPRLVSTRTGGNLTFNWPIIAGPGFAFQSTTNLTPPIDWATVTNTNSVSGDQYVVVIPLGPGSMFFRLKK